jgi:histidinol-phosphate aminotransferase
VLTQLTAEFALQHYHVLEAQTRQIRVDREQLLKHLNAINGVHAWVSEANFILFRVADAFGVFNKLKSKGILIKCLHSSHPLLSNCLRVTVGTAEENQAFLKVLSDMM